MYLNPFYYWRKHGLGWFKKAMIILIVLCVAASGIIYVFLITQSRKILSEQTQARQQVVSRAGALSISEFFKNTFEDATDLSERIAGQDSLLESEDFVEKYVLSKNGTPVIGAFVADSDGDVLILKEARGGEVPHSNISDRDYFLWAQSAQSGDVYLGETVVARFGNPKDKDRHVIPIATPLIIDGEFQGILSLGIDVTLLSEVYVNSLTTAPDVQIILLSSYKNILASPNYDCKGKDIVDYLDGDEYRIARDNINRIFKDTKTHPLEGKLSLAWPCLKGKSEEHLITYSVIDFSRNTRVNNTWVLIIASPLRNIEIFMGQVYPYQGFVYVFIVCVILSISLFGIFIYRLGENEAYLRGFVDGKRKNHKNT